MEPRNGRAVCPRCGRAGDASALGSLFIVTGASGSGKPRYDIEEQVEFGRWLRRDIADRVDTGSGPLEDSAAAIAARIY
jgi:hypothetical protein